MHVLTRSFSLVSLSAGVSLLGAASALAATTLTIEQHSPSTSLGEWRLQMPDGSNLPSFRTEQLRVISNAPAGTYRITVTPPKKANTTIAFYDSGHLKQTADAHQLDFVVGSGSARILISYAYEGIVRIESIPNKATFELAGAGVRFTGVTPAEFTNLPPVQYTVSFGMKDNCNLPRPPQRYLKANETITIRGEYICGDDRYATTSSSNSSSATSAASTSSLLASSSSPQTTERTGALALWQSAHQGEVLPGGTIRFTVGVRNQLRTTVEDLMITQQFDPAQVTPVLPIAMGGEIRGNLIIWEIPRVLAGQSWSTATAFNVHTSLAVGERITLHARASAQDTSKVFVGDLGTATTVGIASLPPTGMASDVLVIGLTLVGAAGLTAFSRRRLIR